MTRPPPRSTRFPYTTLFRSSGGPVTFSWTVQDNGGIANGGADTLNESLAVFVTAGNEPPLPPPPTVNHFPAPENNNPTHLRPAPPAHSPAQPHPSHHTPTLT